MSIQTLEGPYLYLFMAIGLLFTLVGLYLILKRTTDENAAKIELFGLKFQSSSTGTLVFLIGTLFLLTPLFVPKIGNNSNGVVQAPSKEQPNPVAKLDSNSTDVRALVLPVKAEAEEVEPNNQITQANQFIFGFGAKGALDRKRNDLHDWYVIDTSGYSGSDFTVQIRSQGGGCRVYAYDQYEELLDKEYCENSGGSARMDIFVENKERIYLMVTFNGGSSASNAAYEVFLREKD
jgi:hypothetical protein